MVKISSSKKNFLYNSLYQLLSIAIPLIVTPYISRVLGADGIGLYSYSHAIAFYFVMFIMLGLNNYGNRTIAFVRDDKEKLSKTFCEIYTMQMIVSGLVISIYVFYAVFFSNDLITWVMLIYVVSAAFDINWLFFGLEQFKMTATRSSLVKILTTVLIFAFVKSQDGAILYATIMVLGTLVGQLVLWFYLKKFVRIRRVSLKDAVKHLKPNLVLFIPVVAISLYKMMDKIMLGAMTDLEQVGFYESTERIIQVPLALITSLGVVMMPKISNLAAKNDHAKNRKYIEKSLYFAVLIASVMCFGIMAVAKNFVPWYYGENFDPCVALFQILMPSCIFLAVANVVRTQHLIPYKRDRIYVTSVVAGAVVNLIVNILLIPMLKAQGAAIGTFVAECSVCLLQLVMVRRELRIGGILLRASWYIVAGAAMYMVVLAVPDFSGDALCNLLVKAMVGGGVYVALSLPAVKMQKLFSGVSVVIAGPEIYLPDGEGWRKR